MSTQYTEQQIIDMISILQDEQSAKANAEYNFERFIGKQISKLKEIQHKVKVGSNLWKDSDRSVKLFLPQWELTQDESFIIDYDCLADLIKEHSDDIISNIEAFGIFSIHIYVK